MWIRRNRKKCYGFIDPQITQITQIQEGVTTRGALGRAGCAVALVAMVAARAIPLLAAAPSPQLPVSSFQLPPPDAFEDYPGYDKWKVVEIVLAKDGETARIRLRHPESPRVIAILQFRLISSIVVEERP